MHNNELQSELQKRQLTALGEKHFAVLRQKYQVGAYRSGASDSFLYLILRKAELGIQIASLELQWLANRHLFKTIEIISLQQYQAEEFKRLETEFESLRSEYKIPEGIELPVDSQFYSILWKVKTGEPPTESELELLNNHGLIETSSLIQDVLSFAKLKISYKATQHSESFPEEPLYSILKKLNDKEPLTEFEADWLLKHDYNETLEIYWRQDDERSDTANFLDLKTKYRVDYFPDVSISSPLYAILKKIKEKQELDQHEIKWLDQHKLTHLIAIDQKRKDVSLFKKLKIKYKATQYQSSEPSSKLFQILKNIESDIAEKDIQWLLNEDLRDTAEFAKRTHFKSLKTKYRIVGDLSVNPFYDIMLKLERQERLDPKQVVQLIEDGLLSREGRIATEYHRLEAIFYEKEYQRTGNKWNLPSASSNWRKAGESQKALQATENLNWNKIKESNLKSALWVTRGATLRDLEQLDDAKKHAHQAMECQPDSHQPYTLLGALCYDEGQYIKGDQWFEMAAQRGANNIDDEIAKIVRMTKDKDKRREVVEYLLKKDPDHYSWATSYLK